MSYEISDVDSIEMEDTGPFDRSIVMKDKTGYIMKVIHVKYYRSMKVFNDIVNRWMNHKDFKGKE